MADIIETTAAQTATEAQAQATPDTDPVEGKGANETAVAEQSSDRDLARDAAFARLRRDKEAAERSVRDKDADVARLREALKLFDVKGETAAELYANARHQSDGIPVALSLAELQRQDELQQARDEIATLRRREGARILQDDLAAVKKAYPDAEINNIADLGEEFIRLRAAGVNAVVAYNAVRQAEDAGKKAKPVSTESARSSSTGEKEYYSSSELDRLSNRDLDDPKILEKALKSLSRLKPKNR